MDFETKPTSRHDIRKLAAIMRTTVNYPSSKANGIATASISRGYLKLINGNLNDFVDGVYYGYEQEFTYRGQTFFIQSLPLDDGCIYLLLDRWNPPADDYILKLP